MKKIVLALGSNRKSVETIANKMRALLLQSGIKTEIRCADTYTAVQAIIKENSGYDNIVLLERTSKDRKLTLKELTDLTEEIDLNVIPIIDIQHKGTDYCRELYAAGITSALFDSGKGVNPWDITNVIQKKRTRCDARIYYGIDEKVVAEGTLSDLMINDKLTHLTNGNIEEIGRRYIDCVISMTKSQNQDFLRCIPKNILKELINTAEFEQAKRAINSAAENVKIQLEPKYEIAIYEPDKLSFWSKFLNRRKERKEKKRLKKQERRKKEQLSGEVYTEYQVTDIEQYMQEDNQRINLFKDYVSEASEVQFQDVVDMEDNKTVPTDYFDNGKNGAKRAVESLEDESPYSNTTISMTELAALL